MKKRRYVPNDLEIFEGFYESRLFYSDMVYYYNENLPDGEPEHEIDNFQSYMDEIGRMVVNELYYYLCDDDTICSDVEFVGISSPRYYNFSTDKLVMDVAVDLDALKNWVMSNDDRKTNFDKYLKAKYTSCDGFLSFVENNVKEYFEESYVEHYSVLIDYYVLTKIHDKLDVVSAINSCCNDTPYHWAIFENVDEIFYQHMVPVPAES